MTEKKQIYPPTVTESLMRRLRMPAGAKQGADADEKAEDRREKPAPAPKKKPDWKAAVGYGPLVLQVGRTAGKADGPRAGTLKKAVRDALKLAGDAGQKARPILSERIESFDCWFSGGGEICQYTLRRVGTRAEGHARRTASGGHTGYDKPFTTDAAALDGLQRLIGELGLKELADRTGAESGTDAGKSALEAGQGLHLSVWYASGESLHCRDMRKNRLSALQRAAIRGWFEAVAGA